MGTVTSTITADREGFLAYLEEQRQSHLSVAEHSRTQKAAASERGIAEGLELAIRFVRNWEIV